ncbi:hypothetical protein TNCV_881251 [Trichonephila clavipes]|nr:hypothetical protein TNCV_881251 [Trichonephila clavipes]
MVSSAGQGQVPHPSIVPECFTINQLWNDRKETREKKKEDKKSPRKSRKKGQESPGEKECEARLEWRKRAESGNWSEKDDERRCEKCWMQVSPVPASDEVCPPVCASYERCSCVFLFVKSAREVPAFRFFPEKEKEEVSSVSTCNVKVSLFL